MSGLMPMFVAVGYTGARAMWSQDGINWFASLSMPVGSWQTVTYGGGRFVAIDNVGDGAGNKQYSAYSLNGIDWVQGGTLFGAYGTSDISYDGTNFLTCNYQGSVATFSSPDTITWTQHLLNLGISFTPLSLASVVGGRTVIVDTPSSTFAHAFYSPTGFAPWTGGTNITGANVFNGVSHNGNRFIMVGPGPQNAYSNDGITWTFSTTGPNGTACPSGRILACNGNTCVYPTNTAGLGWLTTDGGANWTAVTLSGGTIMLGATYGNGLFVMVGGAACMTSPDGSSWTNRSLPNISAHSVAFAMLPYGDQVFDGKVLDGSNLVAGPEVALGLGSRSGADLSDWRESKTNQGTD